MRDISIDVLPKHDQSHKMGVMHKKIELYNPDDIILEVSIRHQNKHGDCNR